MKNVVSVALSINKVLSGPHTRFFWFKSLLIRHYTIFTCVYCTLRVIFYVCCFRENLKCQHFMMSGRLELCFISVNTSSCNGISLSCFKHEKEDTIKKYWIILLYMLLCDHTLNLWEYMFLSLQVIVSMHGNAFGYWTQNTCGDRRYRHKYKKTIFLQIKE